MVLQYDPRQCLPSSAELPDSDDTPVDNELQNLIPNLLEAILAMAWPNRLDWFFGVDMGVYFDPKQPAIVPDGFLSLGVERFIGEQGRLSYVFWEEDNIPPLLALEVVSKTYGGEYERKKERYADLGVLYYVIYMPNGRSRRKRQVLEIYQLVDGEYKLMEGSPVWLPEVGLGLGRERGTYLGRQREWLYWYDESGQRLCTPEEKAQQAESKAQQAESKLAKLESKAQQAETKAAKLAEKLKELGVDPETV
ncbi:MAG: Uma2 family endonuclease [Cyanobacteria bacterium J06597_16]